MQRIFKILTADPPRHFADNLIFGLDDLSRQKHHAFRHMHLILSRFHGIDILPPRVAEAKGLCPSAFVEQAKRAGAAN